MDIKRYRDFPLSFKFNKICYINVESKFCLKLDHFFQKIKHFSVKTIAERKQKNNEF